METIALLAKHHWPAAIVLVIALCYFLVLSLKLSIIDVKTHTLPNRLVLPAYPISAILLLSAALFVPDVQQLVRLLVGGLAAGIFYWLLWFIYPAGIGFGDVKLAGVIGLYLGYYGWSHLLLGVMAGFVVGGLWGIALIASKRGTRNSRIPFGPAMLIGAWLVMLLLPG